MRYLSNVSLSIVTVSEARGLEKSKRRDHGQYIKDVTDPRWKEDADVKELQAFIAKYMSPTEFADVNAAYGFGAAATMVQVLKQCGNDLSRENIMRQAANLKDLELPLLLPGIKVNTSPTNYSPIREMQLATFNGEKLGAVRGRAERLRASSGPDGTSVVRGAGSQAVALSRETAGQGRPAGP